MPTLEIVNRGRDAFVCRNPNWPASSAEKAAWIQVWSVVLRHAFERGPATLITVSPSQWSFATSVPRQRRARVRHADYLISAIDHCTPAMLDELADSEDFQRGLLWVTRTRFDDEAALEEIMRDIDIAVVEPASSRAELILVLDDGRSLHWLRPSTNVEALARAIEEHASGLGWKLTRAGD